MKRGAQMTHVTALSGLRTSADRSATKVNPVKANPT